MKEVNEHAQVLWDYLILNQEVTPMDAIFAFGSESVRVAERAAELYMQGYGQYLIVSGGMGTGMLGKPEGEVFTDIALARGVPREHIIVENAATNTGENIAFVRTLLWQRGISPQSFLLVHKPYLERRTYATFVKQWPGTTCAVTSPRIPFAQYVQGQKAFDRLITYMMQALYRIHTYPALGFQIEQDIPEDVVVAYRVLQALGYAQDLAL